MAPEWFYLLSPILALTAMVVLQAVVLRLRGAEQFFPSVVAGFLAGLVVAIAMQVALLWVFPRNLDRLLPTRRFT